MKRNRRIIYITYDPTKPDISTEHKRQILLDSKEGRVLYPMILKYQELKAELEKLKAEWDATYWHKPRDIEFPLKKTYNNRLDSSFFEKAKPNQNSYENTSPITYKGQILRTKNELIAVQAIEQMGYDWKTEVKISTDKFATFFPDVLFNVPEIDKSVCMEIDGAMDNIGYFRKSENRKLSYFEQGFAELRDVIFLRINNPNSFDVLQLQSLIYATVETNINDIIIPCRQ